MGRYILAENGESQFHIVNHQYCDETVRYAAAELQRYLLKATNAVIPYFSDRCPMRSREIRIGENVRGETGIEKALAPDGFRIAAAGEHITITASTSRGVLYGVYRFLEIFCGFRAFTKDVEVIDAFEILEIELDEIIEEPAFDFRDAYFRNAFDGDFAVKNRLNASVADISKAKGGRMKWFNFHHSFNDLVAEEIYFDEHPEYFSEIDGKRERNSQLCLTNPDVLDIAEKTLRRWIAENPECTVFSVAQNDNQRRCTCEKCIEAEKKEGSPSGPIIHFVNCLADRIKDDHPDIKLHTFAYQYSLPAPRYAVAGDNVIVRLCSISCRFDKPFKELAKEGNANAFEFVNALEDWSRHAKNLYVWDYAVNFRNYLQPFLHFHTLAKNISFFAETGIKGVLEQGNFAYGGGATLDDLKAYIIARLLWNCDTDIEDEMKRFFDGVYGKRAGAFMREYVELMEKACSSAPIGIYQYPDAQYLTDECIAKADKLFNDAIQCAEGEEYKLRVEREYLAVRFLKLSRLELDAPDRERQIDEFFADVKRFGLTEIRERRSLKATKESMLNGRFARGKSDDYVLYYIMQ